MQKIKIKTTHIKNPRMELEYYLLLKGGMCGIEIRDACSGVSATRLIPDAGERVHKFLMRLARHAVTPCTLNDVVDDYIYENWLGQRRLELLCAGTDARLNRGKRQGKKRRDLRAGVSANKG